MPGLEPAVGLGVRERERERCGRSVAVLGDAIDDAVGIRLTELPLTAEALFRALRAKKGKPLQDE